MMNRWRMIILGLVVVQGSSIIASESPKDLKKVCSKELTAAITILSQNKDLRCSSELRKEVQILADEKSALGNAYYPYCCGGNTPPEYYSSAKFDATRDIYPYYPGHH